MHKHALHTLPLLRASGDSTQLTLRRTHHSVTLAGSTHRKITRLDGKGQRPPYLLSLTGKRTPLLLVPAKSTAEEYSLPQHTQEHRTQHETGSQVHTTNITSTHTQNTKQNPTVGCALPRPGAWRKHKQQGPKQELAPAAMEVLPGRMSSQQTI